MPGPMRVSQGYVFGPVPSRRLGRSLGVDLVPYKTCSYDCIYCQLGRTTDHTCERREYVPTGAVIADLQRSLRAGLLADYITLAGSGEPTLCAGLGRIIRWCKEHCDVPVAVLTNGSLLWRADVREELRDADLLMPSLDAGTASTFARINRPYPSLAFEEVLAALVSLRDVFAGALWLEVMLVRGVNDDAAELERLREAIDLIQPDRVDINTVVRPPAEPEACALEKAQLAAAREALGPLAEVIAPAVARQENAAEAKQARQRIVDLLRRRPCTTMDLAGSLGIHPNALVKHLRRLVEAGLVGVEQHADAAYYTAGRPAAD